MSANSGSAFDPGEAEKIPQGRPDKGFPRIRHMSLSIDTQQAPAHPLCHECRPVSIPRPSAAMTWHTDLARPPILCITGMHSVDSTYPLDSCAAVDSHGAASPSLV